ncbi:MAG: hypothetical protein CMJ46_00700 [Planctomyces sp.]|nr:hypothetical protein [Planctomyces sp.]
MQETTKPKKPYPDFPLFPHATKRWAKKIRGKLHYFGPWRDPQGALQKYIEQRDDLQAGRTPRLRDPDGLSIRELCNRFLTWKKGLLDSDDISYRTFSDCMRTCTIIVDHFGKDRIVEDLVQEDFQEFRVELAKTRNPVSLADAIGRIRSVFKFGYDSGLMDKPVRYGSGFAKPSRRKMREARNQAEARMFEADEINLLLDEADDVLKAMILLGINCGFGQSDLSSLPKAAIDLESGFIDYPRPKTAIPRRCPLWPKTIEALKVAMEKRPEPKNPADANLCFLTRKGEPWVKISQGEKKAWTDSLGLRFGRLLRKIHLKRPGLNFYALRHTFETIAGESIDQVAVNSIMGHVDNSMSAAYRERISDERLIAVSNHVRDWLSEAEAKKSKAKK